MNFKIPFYNPADTGYNYVDSSQTIVSVSGKI